MNYYLFHIGDYAVHTRHLSLLEDLAYRRCLDLYYTHEKPLPADPKQVARLIGMRDNCEETAAVLEEFFAPDGSGEWVHHRCEAEIAKAAAKADAAKVNGKLGGRPKKGAQRTQQEPTETQQVISANPAETGSQAPITHYPLPITHYPLPNTQKDNTSLLSEVETDVPEAHIPAQTAPEKPTLPLPGFAEFWAAWPKSTRKGGKAECEKLWRKSKLEDITAEVVAHVRAMAVTETWTKQGGEFIPAPLVYLRGKRWDGAEVMHVTHGSRPNSKHTGFSTKNYTEGVNPDGTLS